jgi:sialidase-1
VTLATPRKLTLYQVGEGEYVSYRIPATLVTAKGTVLAFCTARRGGGDRDRNGVVLRRSEDGGETWSALSVVATDPQEVADNPCPIAAADGAVHLVYQVGYARAWTG